MISEKKIDISGKNVDFIAGKKINFVKCYLTIRRLVWKNSLICHQHRLV